MSRLDAQEIAHMAKTVQEMLVDAGFTDVKLAPGAPSMEAVKALSEEDDEDGDNPFGDPKFAENIGYHRVTTDQAVFGIWFDPYVTIDIGGLGLDANLFQPPDYSGDKAPEGWCLIGLDEGVLPRLFIELIKKSRQP